MGTLIQKYESDIAELNKKIEQQEERIDQLQEILIHYADPHNWADAWELAVDGCDDKCIWRPSGHGFERAAAILDH